MKTVIIYESMYGNTQLVADELAAVAREHGEVVLVRAEDAGAGVTEGADLVLVGGPDASPRPVHPRHAPDGAGPPGRRHRVVARAGGPRARAA